MDHYGEGYLKLILVNEDGSYIDISNEDELKKYVVTAQNLEPNTELKYTFEKDEEGEEYSLVAYQNIEEIVLAVKEVGSDSVAKRVNRDYCFSGSVYLVYPGLCRKKSGVLRIHFYGRRISGCLWCIYHRICPYAG